MRRLPIELVASGGKPLISSGDVPVVDLLVKAAGGPGVAAKRVTIHVTPSQ
jgi:hypothetical protein